ncbi:heat shock factor protein isoform X2 [Chelonus insularis]|uniref:heat shock factor protein isoform X2 n=1 Tax=Chelonus insularis TaxID=460826 RepID=UPI00158C81B3|nr:heat shock factor protein isoform X2 [Chelonus insularis]
MHTVMEVETSVPAFLGKLWKLVEDPETDDLICWAPNGRSFFIRNSAQFARELLPHYYKHNNMASFVRQLNMYGFHKKVSVELGGLKCDRDEMEFAHQYFIKDHPYLLEHIKRKIASSKSQDAHPPIKTEMMNKVLNEVRSMRGRQEHMDSRLGTMKRENEALWRELAMLRRKHLKQQEIVNKLIHFLVTLVQPSRSGGLSVKRRYPLMIDDHQRNKKIKVGKNPEASPTGPVIHELDASEHDHHEDLDSEYIVAEMLENHQHPAIQSPESMEAVLDDENIETVQYIEGMIPVKGETQPLQQECSSKKKAVFKPTKKKRKNKLPVKILIPSSEIGEEPREERLMLEVSPDETPVPIELLGSNTPQQLKPVPVKTVRSSKLAAMAANIKMNSAEADEDPDSDEVEEDPKEATEIVDVNLDDILIIPDVLLPEETKKLVNGELNNKSPDETKKSDTTVDSTKEKPAQDKNSTQVTDLENKSPDEGDAASSSSTKSLSLSCVNPSGMTNAAYRLGSIEEMDNHLESMQTELENLREILRNEGYSIDANTLLGLFGNDDPMSFGIPVNPELDPTRTEREEEERLEETSNGPTGQELMTYNPSSNLLDFDDDIFLGANNLGSSSNMENQNETNGYYTQEPLDLEDSKALLLDSLVSGNGNSSSMRS